MPKNSIMDTRNPAMVATFVELLRAYSAGEQPQTNLERGLWQTLEREDPNRQITTRQIARFDGIRPSVKIQVFGDTSTANLRGRPEAEMRRIFAAHDLTFLSGDDVGRAIVPTYPPGTQFFIEYMGLYCLKDTNDRFIFGGSDEVYVITAAVEVVGGQNTVRTEKHPVGDPNGHYGGVDAGETRLGPIAACWSGSEPASEVSLVVVMMEHDEGDPDAFEDEIRVIVAAAAAIAALFNIAIGAAILALAEDVLKWLVDSEDDSIGTVTEIFTPDGLKIVARNPTRELIKMRPVFVPTGPFSHTIQEVEDRTGLMHHRATRHTASGEYYAGFRVRSSSPPVEQAVAPDQELVIGGLGRITF